MCSVSFAALIACWIAIAAVGGAPATGFRSPYRLSKNLPGYEVTKARWVTAAAFSGAGVLALLSLASGLVWYYSINTEEK